MKNTEEILSITIVLAALFAYINHRVIRWPPTIRIMALSLICWIILVVLSNPRSLLSEKAVQFASAVYFEDLPMNFMLSFLLFAGAIHIYASKLKSERWPVLLLTTMGALISINHREICTATII